MVTPVSAAAAPGVYRQDIVLQPAPALVTGCPIILGYASGGPVLEPTFVTSAADFAARFVAGPGDGYLAETVDSFFVNGGVRAWIVRLENLGPNLSALQAITTGLQAAAQLDADLVCAPDIVRQRGLGETASPLAPDKEEVALMQQAVVADCERLATRVAILDALPAAVLTSTGVALGSSGSPIDAALVWQRDLLGGSPDAALYHPWISTGGGATGRFVPPCGAVAGIIARSDQQSGVHKAPANEPVLGCVDLEDGVDAARQRPLNQAGINCIRAFPGRGIRVWGARTVSKSAWPYLNVRRVVLTTARWAARALHDVAFEPSAPEVWARVTRLVASYLQSLYQQGALIGATPGEAFSVACDATTNTPELRALGRLAVSVTLNAGPPSEIVLLRLVRDETGVTIQSSSSPG